MIGVPYAVVSPLFAELLKCNNKVLCLTGSPQDVFPRHRGTSPSIIVITVRLGRKRHARWRAAAHDISLSPPSTLSFRSGSNFSLDLSLGICTPLWRLVDCGRCGNCLRLFSLAAISTIPYSVASFGRGQDAAQLHAFVTKLPTFGKASKLASQQKRNLVNYHGASNDSIK